MLRITRFQRCFTFRLIFITLLFSLAPAAHGENIYLKPTSGSGISKAELSPIDELLSIAVKNSDGANLTDNEAKADAVLEPKIIKIGSALVLSLSKLRAGKTVFHSQARSKTLEDMDVVTARVVKAVMTEVSFDKNGGVSDVTDDEVKKVSKRKETTKQWVFGLGPGFADNIATSGGSSAWNLGYQWEVNYEVAIKMAFEWLSIKDSNASFSNFYIGSDYFLNERDISPFVSGAFGYGTANLNDPNSLFAKDRASGFSLSGGVGIKFYRSSTVSLGLSAKYIYILDQTSKGSPSASMIHLNIYF